MSHNMFITIYKNRTLDEKTTRYNCEYLLQKFEK